MRKSWKEDWRDSPRLCAEDILLLVLCIVMTTIFGVFGSLYFGFISPPL